MKEHDTGPYEPFGLEYDEGWAVFEIDRDDGLHLEIQRLESPQEARSWHPREPLFESDEAAIAFVRKRAEEGSQYHREALAIHGKIEPYHDMEEVEESPTRVVRLCLDVTVPKGTSDEEVETAINNALNEPPCDWEDWMVGSAYVVHDY